MRPGDKFNPELRKKFLEVMRQTGNPNVASKAIGMTSRALYYQRERHQDFADEWRDAWEEYVGKLEAEVDRRAVEGVVSQIYTDKHGDIREIRKYSDNLLMFRLKALKPEMYRDYIHQNGVSPQILQVLVQKVLVYLDDEQANELLEFVGKQIPNANPQRLTLPTRTATGAEAEAAG